MTSAEVRKSLVDAIRLDLVGPGEGPGDDAEVLAEPPSRWYLTGFLVPTEASAEQRSDEAGADELAQTSDGRGDDNTAPEPAAARRSFFPSAIGMSFLVAVGVQKLVVTARWGDYAPVRPDPPAETPVLGHWKRTPRVERIEVTLPAETDPPKETDVPGSKGLKLATSVRTIHVDNADVGLPKGTRSVSVFLVNRRKPGPDVERDIAFAFQAQLVVDCAEGFVGRLNLRTLRSKDWDESVFDVQYRDVCEYGVGHSVATDTVIEHGKCRTLRTVWIPSAEVERVAPAEIPGVELSMDVLAETADLSAKLAPLAIGYRGWIEQQKPKMPKVPQKRRETAEQLLQRAGVAAGRIEDGIKLLADPVCLEAFRIANRTMAEAVRRRQGVFQGKDPATLQPKWRPFQLAFVLMNLPGIAEPTLHDREVVDLLFFPTGGGKTEAYLGLAAFTLVLRRLRHPGIASAGLSVLMRYTLRLLTLDQLSRAATLICALELERQKDVTKLGEWPFEIGLWVGRAATPNRMGRKGDNDRESARSKTIAFLNDDRKPAPIPLENCPWCNAKFKTNSFRLLPNNDEPTDLRIACSDRSCTFTRDRALPIVAVDEPIYRRLPCFMIATVDKFAAMPWTGEVGGFFGKAEQFDKHGFFGPCDPGQGTPLPAGGLPPPDLIIQDELHLISGPLGTLVGLYETALDELCSRDVGGKKVRPKIIASTATVRRAENQIRALFNRRMVDIFPPPGPDRRDSFFAETHSPERSSARLYVGIASQGRSPKAMMLKTYLALLGAAQKAYGPKKDPAADPYMTLLGYFNSLRELGGARRLIEDEVGNRLLGYSARKREGATDSSFADRKIGTDVVELTSRVHTGQVADAKRKLELRFSEKDHVDVAIATNMISVGLDIVRLGLMVVYGQPKTSAEYIQATSRVGRDHERPGLVVTLLNIHKARDRSHYERFAPYHAAFYGSVEATSVTPFSPRALDRGLAGTLVALARHGHMPLTPPKGAGAILEESARLGFVVKTLAERAESHADLTSAEAKELGLRVRARAKDLLDDWSKIAMDLRKDGVELQYQQEEGGNAGRLLYEFLSPDLRSRPARYKKFRANRSLRDVEPTVDLSLRLMDGTVLDEEEE